MRYTVIGAGHGGQALAAYLTYKGKCTTLYNRTPEVIQNIQDKEGVILEGMVQAKVKLKKLTSSIGEAIEDAEVILIAIPADEHEKLAKHMAPYIKEYQKIVLVPGRCLGAYYFERVLRREGVCGDILVAETDTFLLTSRKVEDGMSHLISFKDRVCLASKNREGTEKLGVILEEIFPMIDYSKNYIYTTLNNIGAIFHPIPVLLNVGRIENKQYYAHYKEGVTPSIAYLMQKLDAERVAVARKLGEDVPTARKWLVNVYGSKGNNLYQALQDTYQYNEVCAPLEMSTRYIYEDIRTGVVPIYCLGEILGVKCKIAKLVIELATEMLDYDFVNQGRCDMEIAMDFIQEME